MANSVCPTTINAARTQAGLANRSDTRSDSTSQANTRNPNAAVPAARVGGVRLTDDHTSRLWPARYM